MKQRSTRGWSGWRLIFARWMAMGTLLVLVAGCGRKPEDHLPGAASTAPTTPAPKEETPPHSATAQPAPAASRAATPEMASATVQVTMSGPNFEGYGTMGLLLNREACIPPLDGAMTHRMVVAWAGNHTEEQLRGKGVVIQVQREKTDPQGKKKLAQLPCVLENFDSAGGIVILRCVEDFPVRLDAGFMASANAVPQYVFRGQVGNNQPATLLPATLQGGALKIKEDSTWNPVTGDVVASLDEQGKLTGLANLGEDNTWRYHKLTVPTTDPKGLYYIPQSLVLSRKGPNYLEFTVSGKFHDPAQEVTSVDVTRTDAPPGEMEQPKNPEADQPAITPNNYQRSHFKPDGSILLQVTLNKGFTKGEYLFQMQLKGRKSVDKPLFRSAPFVLSLEYKDEEWHYSTRGLSGSAVAAAPGPPAAPDGAAVGGSMPAGEGVTVQEMETEGSIVYGFPIREGREVLLRLDAAPYWKRLSLEKKAWLPLPTIDLAKARLAGNKEALFALIPGTRELKRYDLETLQEQKAVVLPEDAGGLDVAAGLLSSDAPVTLINVFQTWGWDSHELTSLTYPRVKDSNRDSPFKNAYHRASGDGNMVLRILPEPNHSRVDGGLVYHGWQNGYAADQGFRTSQIPTVSSDYPWDQLRNTFSVDKGRDQNGKGTMGVFSTSPIWFHVAAGDDSVQPPKPGRCELHSYFFSEPFLTFDLPQFAHLSIARMDDLSSRLWLDPYSFRIALWHLPKKVVLCSFDRSKFAPPPRPVLMNFPETVVQRGHDFQFKPLIWGGAGVKPAGSAPPGLELKQDESFRWHVPEDTMVNEEHFAFALLDSSRADMKIPVTLRIDGPRPVTAYSTDVEQKDVPTAKLQNASGMKPQKTVIPLESRFYRSDTPIEAVIAGLDDYLILRKGDKTLALFSTKDWKIAGSYHPPDTNTYFAAGDCLLVYDVPSRTLNRLALPECNIVAHYSLPAEAQLTGLSVGESPESPVAVTLKGGVAAPPPPAPSTAQPIGRKGFTPPPPTPTKLVILDKQTLTPSTKFAPFIPPVVAPVKPPAPEPLQLLYALHGDPIPRLPSSWDGKILQLPVGAIVISPVLTVGHRYPVDQHIAYSLSGQQAAHWLVGSPSGDRFFWDSHLTIGGKEVGSQIPGIMSRCGNYIAPRPSSFEGNPTITLYLTDGPRPFLTLGDLEILQMKDEELYGAQERITPVGEKNLFVLLSKGGLLMQVVTLNVPEVYRRVAPEAAMVTSHPSPFVAAGRSMTYQITVNNPEAVASYRLRIPVPGAAVDNQGRFTYQAPADLKESQQANIALDIELKNKRVVYHEFPIYVVPFTAGTRR